MTDIELVIKMSKEEYERLPYIDIFKLRKYIENGTPLPKGHGRLVDASALRADSFCVDGEELLSINDLIIAPTIVEADKEE